MSSIYCNADTSASNRAELGPTLKFNLPDAEVGLTATTDIHQRLEADGNGEPAPQSKYFELTSDRPTDVGLKQPHPDRHELFRDALFRLEKFIYPTDSLEPTIGPLPEEEMPDLDLSSNRFWLADQRRKAEQPPTYACSTKCSASGDPSCRPSSPRSAPRTPEPEPERTLTPPHTPFATMEARLIIQLLRKFGPGGNPDEGEYGWPPADSESGSEWDDDGVMDP